MKSRLLSLTLFLFLSGGLFAQNVSKTERMQRREARKQRQAMELAQSRAEMAKLVKLRRVPRLVFIQDKGQENADRINALLAELARGKK